MSLKPFPKRSNLPPHFRDGIPQKKTYRQLSLFDISPPEVVRELDPPCRCGSVIGKEILEPEPSPHYSRLTCLSCGRWIKFVAKKDSLLGGEN